MNERRGKERRTGAALHSFIAVVGPSLCPGLVESIGESAARAGAGRCPAFPDALGLSEMLGEVLRQAAAAVVHRQALMLSPEEALRFATSPEGIAFLKEAIAEYHEKKGRMSRSRRVRTPSGERTRF
jgi:hypothetical protein